MSGRTYLAIDLKSFYASVECVERGLDPMTTHLVVADQSRTDKTICLAVSPALKAYGVPGRARLFEARQAVEKANRRRRAKAPGGAFSGKSWDETALAADPALEMDILVAPPRMAHYIEVSARVYQVYLRFAAPADIHVYSIDEVFIDATDYLKSAGVTAEAFAREAVRQVLEATGITSVAPLSGSAIRYLNVRSTWVSNYTPLERCPDLTRLVTGELPDGAASTLAGLTTLEELRLYSTPDIDLTLFSELQRLRALDLYACTLSHLEALSQLNSLYYLNIGETGLEDLSFLPTLPALAELELRENPLTDLTPLLDCPWLTHLTLSSRHQALAQEQLLDAPFQISYG